MNNVKERGVSIPKDCKINIRLPGRLLAKVDFIVNVNPRVKSRSQVVREAVLEWLKDRPEFVIKDLEA